MGKSKNKTCRVGMRLTQNEKDTLNDILEYRGIGISDFLVKAIDEEAAKVKKERSDAYIQKLLNGKNADY